MGRFFFLIIIFFIQFAYSFEPQTAKVLLIGEEHTDTLSREHLIAALPNFKKMGYTYLALEMIKDNRQEILNNFCENPTLYKDSLLGILDKEWHYNPNSYFSLISIAAQLGFKIIALDMPRSELPKEILPFPVPPDQSLEMAARNERMASHIAQVLNADADAKVLALVGKYHATDLAIPKILKDNFDITSTESRVLSHF
jgi:uncharacterized iron-regulated protein